MHTLLLTVGRIAGAGGAVLAVVAAGVRLTGHFRWAGFEAGTLLNVGVAAMVLACVCYLTVIAERVR